MQIDAKDAAALRAVLRKDLDAIAHLEEHAHAVAGTELVRSQTEALGFTIHNIYNALDNSFVQISLTFENHVKDQSRWHREVLEKMFLPVPPLRPAVLPATVHSLLADLLAFRHVFRHSYESTLDREKTLALFHRWADRGQEVRSALESFCAQLARASQSSRPQNASE